MDFVTRIEQIGPEHIEPYIKLSKAEYGDAAAVSKSEHLRWKFIENPQGASTGIHLYDASGELMGRMTALTRRFLHEGKDYRAAHIVDFLVHPKMRGMPALFQLATGLKKLSGFDFLLIIAPNPAGATVWEKLLKMRGRFDLDIMAAPLRPFATLQAMGKLGGGKVFSVLDWSWQLLVGSGARFSSHLANTQIESHWPRPDELDRMLSAGSTSQAIGFRSADYLDWRYRRSPVFKYNMSFLREHGELIGYVVTRRTVHDGIDCMFVVDAFCGSGTKLRSLQAAVHAEISRAARSGPQLALIMGNRAWGPLSAISGLPFLKVPSRVLPRKTAVFAEWLTPAAFEIRRDNFYVSLGDSDVV